MREQLVSECTESDVSTINSLANVGWPLLKGFSSVGRIPSAECLQQLSKAHWPFMERIVLSRSLEGQAI